MAKQTKQPLYVNSKSYLIASLQSSFKSSKEIIVCLALDLHLFAESCEADQTTSVANILGELINLAHHCGYSLEECVQIAYNDIKDRKGLMHNGVFIKESDPAYAKVIAEIEGNYNAE